MNLLEKVVKNSDFFYKKDQVPQSRIGDSIKVIVFLELPNLSIGVKGKERIQVYEGIIISKHRNANPTNSTVTVRKMFQNGGIEKVFLIHSPWIKMMNILSSARVRRSKLYYLRKRMGKSARLKRLFT
jgi:large subunit ribosomal protein L19